MEVRGSHTVAIARERVWQLLTDHEVLARVTPGVTHMEPHGDGRFHATMRLGIGPLRGTFEGSLELRDLVETMTLDIEGAGGPATTMDSEQRPNILFVFSDQQRYGALGANGNPIVQTPAIDSLAAQGMVCDNMFSNHPLCSPYRAILLTGCYAWNNLVIDNEYRPRRDIPTLPSTLREHGYGTGQVGTFHLGEGPYPPEDHYGLDYLAAPDLHSDGGYFNQRYLENESGPTTIDGWGPEVETDLAIRFMERHLDARPADPFALFVSWRPPHRPYTAVSQ